MLSSSQNPWGRSTHAAPLSVSPQVPPYASQPSLFRIVSISPCPSPGKSKHPAPFSVSPQVPPKFSHSSIFRVNTLMIPARTADLISSSAPQDVVCKLARISFTMRSTWYSSLSWALIFPAWKTTATTRNILSIHFTFENISTSSYVNYCNEHYTFVHYSGVTPNSCSTLDVSVS